MQADLKVSVAVQIPNLDRAYMRKATEIYNKTWGGNYKNTVKHLDHHEQRVVEYIALPDEFRGQNIAVYVVLVSENGFWKYDWHFEGVSILLEKDKKKKTKSKVSTKQGKKK